VCGVTIVTASGFALAYISARSVKTAGRRAVILEVTVDELVDDLLADIRQCDDLHIRLLLNRPRARRPCRRSPGSRLELCSWIDSE
jgi:hypothetical protein